MQERGNEAELPPDVRIRHNTEILFGVIDAIPDSESTTFYSLQYADADPTLVEGVTTLDLHPTGARRQEVRGPNGRAKFHQAQYIVGEISTSAETPEPYFAWLPTFPSDAFEQPIINEIQLEQSTGYQALTTGNITKSLLSGIESLEEHLCLIDAVQSRDMRVTKELQGRIQLLGGRAILSILNEEWRSGSDKPHARVALQDIFETMANVDRKVQRSLQGRALSIILQTLPSDFDKQIDIAKRDDVLETLKFALESGLFPNESRMFNRFLLHPTVYQDPFFVDYLEKTVERSAVNRPGSKNIFGVERETAAHDIMTSMIYAKVMDPERSGEATEHARSMVRDRRLIRQSVREKSAFNAFFNLADTLGYEEYSGKDEGNIRRDRKNQIRKHYEIIEAFRFIMAEVEKDQPGEESTTLDESCVRSIESILLPRAEQLMINLRAVANAANQVLDMQRAKEIAAQQSTK